MCPQEPWKISVTLILQRIVHSVCAKGFNLRLVFFSGIAFFFLNHLFPIYPNLTFLGALLMLKVTHIYQKQT